MPESWILKSKLTPPSPPADWQRRRLDAAQAPVTLLVGGPGGGKTLGLLSFHAEAASNGVPTVWYSLDAQDADAATVFLHLTAGMESHIPQFGETLRALLGGDRLDPALLWQAFFDTLASFNLPGLALFLDDVQHLESGLSAALASFFSRLPAGCRLFLSSRDRPSLPAGSEAWVAVLDQARLGAKPEALYQEQGPERRTFMLQAALLQEVTPEAIARVFDRPDAATALAELEAEHLIQRLAAGGSYRFGTHLGEFLLAELERNLPEATRRAWHRRAATVYRLDGRLELALPHYMAAQEWEEARSACQALMPGMRYSGRQAQLQRWLEAFPASVRDRDPWLTLFAAHTYSRGGKSAEALTAYTRARALYAERGDAAGAFKALVGQCNTALTLLDMPAFARTLAAAQAHTGDRHDEDVADLWLIRAYEGERQGDMAQMRAYNEAALGIPIGGNIEVAASHCIARMNLYTLALYQGELARARTHIDQVLAIAEAWHFYPYRLSAGFLEAHLHLLAGDLEGASAFLGSLPHLWRKQLDWHDLAVAHTVLGAYHALRGEGPEAERELATAAGLFTEAGFQEGRLVPIERQMWLAVGRKQFARADRLWKQLPRGGAEGIHHLAVAIPYARLLHLQGLSAEALAVLAPALDALAALGAKLHLARGRLHEAALRLKLGEAEGARAAYHQALALIEAGGYGFLRGQDQRLWEELAPLAAPVAEAAPGAEPAGPAIAAGAAGRLAIRCLGAFEVRLDGVALDQWQRKKARWLLAALALFPQGLGPRELDALLGAGEADPENAWRVNAWALRRTLEPGLRKGQASRYVTYQDERYRLDWAFVHTFDLAEFDRAMAEAEAIARENPTAAIGPYERALALVRGNLLSDAGLAGCFQAEREAFRRRAVGALLFLAATHRKVGDYGRAEKALARAVALAPCDEEVHLAHMRLYRALGHDAKLRAAYWDCRRALKRHAGTAPSEAFETAYRALLS